MTGRPDGGLRPGWRHQPHPDRLPGDRPDRAAILAAHDAALAEGRSTYADPATGLTVMTADTLAGRGWCCDSGCRHCPYVGAPGPS